MKLLCTVPALLLFASLSEAIPWSAVFRIPELKINVRLFNNLTGKSVHHHYNCTRMHPTEEEEDVAIVKNGPSLAPPRIPAPSTYPYVFRSTEAQYVPPRTMDTHAQYQNYRPREEYRRPASQPTFTDPWPPYQSTSDNPYRRNYARFAPDS